MQAPINWNMGQVFTGGVAGADFTQGVEAIRAQAQSLLERSESLPALEEDFGMWAQLLLDFEDFEPGLKDCWTYTHCLSCADTQDKEAARAESRIGEIWSQYLCARIPVESGLCNASTDTFNTLVSREELQPIRSGLENLRREKHLLLPEKEQALSESLSQDGINAWGQLYSRHSGRMVIEIDGESLSSSQVFNRFSGDSDPNERRRFFEAYQSAWATDRELWATIMTHITGTRRTLNQKRGLGPLDDVLTGARMQRESLDAMHEAIAMFRVELLPYLKGKAQCLGLESLGWQDLRAPLGGSGLSHSWEESVDFVLTHFKSAQEPLFQLAKQAFEEGWIEAEDRPHKRAGGWCAGIPKVRQSRIFMTHGGSFGSTVTLAHELGHAYHNSILWQQSASVRRVPMTLAETASVFAENVVRDAALASAQDPADQLAMLDARLRSAVSFLMDIPTRFSYELALYDLREKGEFDPDALDELMLACQKEHFCDALSTWNPTFWSSKLHFFMGRRSFYNFPYSFGYLFSSLVYAMAQEAGAGFEARYVRLLQETGWRKAEEIAEDHLGLDLTDPATWLKAMEPIRKDLKAFSALL